MRLSKSSIHIYEFCPFRFYLNKVKKIEEPGGKPYAMERGIEIHDELYNAIYRHQPVKKFKEIVENTKALLGKLGKYRILLSEYTLNAFYKDMELIGIVDLLIQSGDRIILIDYKTGKDRGLSHHRFELALYTYILNQNGIEPTHWGIIFVDYNKIYIENVKEEIVDRAVGKAYDIYLKIKDGNFNPNRFNCSYCPYREICDSLKEMYGG